MKAKKIKAIIEKADNGDYGVYIPDIPGYIGLGLTEDDAKQDLGKAIQEVVSYCKEKGIPDDLNSGNIIFDYRYDVSGFFKRYNIFDVSALAKEIGMNPTLLRQYKADKTYISQAQKERIEKGIHNVAEELLCVRF